MAPSSKKVLIIGAGLAGITAAYAAQGEGVEVILLDRGAIGLGTNSAMSNAVLTGPTSVYPAEKYVADTLDIGKHLNRKTMVDIVARTARDAFAFLQPWGFNLNESPKSYVFENKRPDEIRGAGMMKALSLGLGKLPGVHLMPNFQVNEILRSEEEFIGVKGFDNKGRLLTIYAETGILAGGGAGALYGRNDNQKSTLGQGYCLAAQAGLHLWDMEFVQFYPLVLAQAGLPQVMLYPHYPPEAKVINQAGEDILLKYGVSDASQAIMTMRDAFALMLHRESLRGPLYMDFRQVPAPAWSKYPLALLSKMKFDFRTKPVEIKPGTHFFMGGIAIDEAGQTALKGLFACGETVWGLHGANRRGGNALTECVVFGRLAGQEAARSALNKPGSSPPAREESETLPLSSPRPEFNSRELLKRLREIAWQRAGVIRDEANLQKGLLETEALQDQVFSLEPEGLGEWRRWQDLKGAVLVLQAIITASLARKESRGAFCRDDYPEEGGDAWKCNSCLSFDPLGNTFSLTHHPVV